MTAMPRELASVRYTLHPLADAAEDWLTQARWHDAEDVQVEGDLLIFQVRAGVANGLERGERYAIAVADAQLKGMVRGEILWPDQAPVWSPGDPDPTSALAAGSATQDNQVQQEKLPSGRSSHSTKLFFAASAILALVAWWALPSFSPQPPQTPSVAESRKNSPPVATTFSVQTMTGASLVIDTRERARDVDGDTPRLLEVTAAQYGKVERVDDYHFRYSAPARPTAADIFLYRVVDSSSTTGDGWVFVNVDASQEPQAEKTAEALHGQHAPISPPAKSAGSSVTTQQENTSGPAVTDNIEGTTKGQIQPTPTAPTATQTASAPPHQDPTPQKAVTATTETATQAMDLRGQIAAALDEENIDRVKSLCGEAMATNASLAKFCGIIFDPTKRLFDAHPDASFALACYTRAAELGDGEAPELAAALPSTGTHGL